jgi:3-dehydroquinate dehydratase I
MYKIIATAGEDDLEKLETLDSSAIDVLEVRLDLFSKKYIKESLHESLKKWNKSLLFTYRLKEDSNQKKHTKIKYDYISYLLDFYNSENNYIDIDIIKEDSIFNRITDSKYTHIYSYHDFNGFPKIEKMKSFINSIKDKNNNPMNIYKFAVYPSSSEEDFKFLEAGFELSKENKMILIIMGERGIYTRIFGDLFGSSFTYACLDEPRAPGQIKGIDLLKFRKISGKFK